MGVEWGHQRKLTLWSHRRRLRYSQLKYTASRAVKGTQPAVSETSRTAAAACRRMQTWQGRRGMLLGRR